MNFKKLKKDIFILKIDKGEKILETIKNLCKFKKIYSGYFTGLGAVNQINVALFKVSNKEYIKKELYGEYEITNITGNITQMNNEIYLHTHITFSDTNFNAYGGHLIEATVSGTCEIIIHRFNNKIKRKFDNDVGLNLLNI